MRSPRTIPSPVPADADPAAAGVREVRVSPELEAELREAMGQIDRGEFVELTFEQLDRTVATGEWPWPDDESPG